MAITPTPETVFQPDNPHRFQKGAPGRPKGSRNKLASRFFDNLYALWDEQGESVLARAAFHEPMAFAAMVAKLMPQKHEITTPTSGMTDERLEQLIAFAEAMAAAKAGVGGAQAIEGSGETGGGGPVVLGPSGVGVPPIPYTALTRNAVPPDGPARTPIQILQPARVDGQNVLLDVTPKVLNAEVGIPTARAPDNKPALKQFSRGAIARPPVPAANPRLDQARALAHGRDAETENSYDDDEPDLSIFD